MNTYATTARYGSADPGSRTTRSRVDGGTNLHLETARRGLSGLWRWIRERSMARVRLRSIEEMLELARRVEPLSPDLASELRWFASGRSEPIGEWPRPAAVAHERQAASGRSPKP